MLNSPVLIGGGTTVSKTRMGSQETGSPKCPTISVVVRNAQILHTSINGDFSKNGNPTPTFSKVIGRELSHEYSADIYLHCRVNFTRNAVGTKSPKSMNLGLLAVHTLDELGSFSTPATRVGRLKDGSKWSAPGYVFGKATAVGVSGPRSEKNYSSKTDFETRRENQYFEWQNISMSRSPLDSTPFGMNTANIKTSLIDSIPVRTEMPDPMPLKLPTDLPTLPTDSSQQKGKCTHQRTWSHTHHRQTHHQKNLIF